MNETPRETELYHVLLSLINDVAGIRDKLEPIVKGQIQRGRNLSQYDMGPTFRKTNLKDAREICGYQISNLNRVMNRASAEADKILGNNLFPKSKYHEI